MHPGCILKLSKAEIILELEKKATSSSPTQYFHSRVERNRERKTLRQAERMVKRDAVRETVRKTATGTARETERG